MPDWVKGAQGKAVWRDRFMAQHCFMILANTGLRIGELRNLRWCDLSKRPAKRADGTVGYYRIGYARKSKTIPHEFAFNPGCEASLSQIYRNRTSELKELADGPNDPAPNREEFIFCHPDGSLIESYRRSFKSLLDYAGVPVLKDGKARTIYSLRHYYATRQLRKEASIHLLARQMGTSVEMLEKHYSHVMTRTVAEQVTKAAATNLVTEDELSTPF